MAAGEPLVGGPPTLRGVRGSRDPSRPRQIDRTGTALAAVALAPLGGPVPGAIDYASHAAASTHTLTVKAETA